MGIGESHHSADESNGVSEPPDLLTAAHIVASERAERAVATAFPDHPIRSGRPGREQIVSILRDLLDNHTIDVARNEDDLREVLAMPRRISARNSVAANANRDDDSSSSEFDDVDMSHRTRSRTAKFNEEFRHVTSDPKLQKSYEFLMHDLESRNGACHFMEDRFSTTKRGYLPDMLFRREINLGKRGHFTEGQRATIMNSYIPNTRKTVGVVKSKTFCAQFVDSGNAVITASQDGQFRLYKRGAREQFTQLSQTRVPAIGWAILDFIVSADGRHLIYSTWDTNLYQCSLGPGGLPSSNPEWQSLPIIENDRFAAFSLKFNVDDSEIVAGGTEGNYYIYNRELNRVVLRVEAHTDDVNAVAFADSSSHLILSASDDGLCKVWDRRILADPTHNPSPVGVFAGHRDGLTFIDARGDDRYVLTNSKDQMIKLWDLRHFASSTGEKATRHSVTNQRWDYRWEPNHKSSQMFVPLKGDCSVMTFHGAHSVLHTLIRARFSPSHTGKRFIYSGCARGNVAVYDMYTGGICTQLQGHKSVVRDCQWHPTLNQILTTSWDGQTSLWKYDERAERDINPNCFFEETGCEDSCDENFRPMMKVRRRIGRNKEKKTGVPRFNSYNMKRPELPEPDQDVSMEPMSPTSSHDSDDESSPQSYAQAARRGKRAARQRR